MKRRDFLKTSAAGITGTIAGGATFFAWSPRIYAANIPVNLKIVSGIIKTIDHTDVYMFGFSESSQIQVPGTSIVCQEGDTITISLDNTLNTNSSFVVTGTNIQQSVAAGDIVSFSFTAPAAGSYLYYDALNNGVNRVMGLHGALIVMPNGINNRSFADGPTFVRQYKWVLENVDSTWCDAVLANGDNHVASGALTVDNFKPNYFMINGQSFEETHINLNTDIRGNFDEPGLVRIMNAGMATHSPHFHGNHVDIVSINRQNFASNRKKKDIVSMFPLDCRDVLYPFKRPPDAWPPVGDTPQKYPMHCHAEPSQTAGGGLYPHGMHTGIAIGEAPPTEPTL